MNHGLFRNSVFAFGIVISSGLALAAGALGPERESTMKGLNKEVKALNALVKSGKFNAAKAKSSATAIETGLNHAKTLFPLGSEKAAKGTAPAIWTDRAGFDEKFAKALEASKAVAAATDLPSLKAAVDTQGGACKSCHETYRTADY